MTQTLSKNVIADFETQLAVKMAVGATTGTLVSATDDDGVTLPTGVYFLTLNRTTSKKEYIKCTLTGTALTNIQSISRQGVLTTGCAREHRVGANVIISDFASLAKINDLLTGVTDFDASTPLKYDGTATISDDAHLTTKKYVNDQDDLIDGVIATLDAQNVKLTGNQTVAGVKTFSSSPVVPTPTSSTDAANKAYADGLAIAGAPDSSTTVKGIGRVSVAPSSPTTPIFVGDNDPRVPTQAEKDALVGTGTPSSANKYVTNDTLTSKIKFGGTGADGALSVSSGTTNIDLGGAQVVVKNYTSISITGTGAISFTNPHASGTIIILKSQGNVTITSSTTAAIDASGMGAVGVSTRGGSSGRGGAGLYIECAGALNFTGTIKNNGQDGTISTNQNGANAGGGAGSTLILYNTLTANSGTSQTNAGSASAQQTGSFSALGNGTDGNTAYGFFRSVTGGAGGNTGTTNTSTIQNPGIYSHYAKAIYVMPGSSGGSGGLTSGPSYRDGQVGNGLGISTIALNTEIV